MFQTYNHIEGRSFTGTIGTQKAYDGALLHFQAYIIDHPAAIIFFYQIPRLDLQSCSPLCQVYVTHVMGSPGQL